MPSPDGPEDSEAQGLAPAWTDDHDAEVTVNLAQTTRARKLRKTETEAVVDGAEYAKRLRGQFEKGSGSTDWALLPEQRAVGADGKASSDDDDAGGARALLTGTKGILSSLDSALSGSELKVTRVKDANMVAPSDAVVTSARFHRDGQVLMTAGLDKTIRLFHIDGLRNTKLHSVVIDRFPIRAAEFTSDGRQIVATARRHHFHVLDVHTGAVTRVPGIKGRKEKSFENFAMAPGPAGKYMAMVATSGNVLVLSQKNKQLLFSVKANADVVSCAFSGDGQTLRAITTSGEVYQWDLRTRRCLSRFADEGAVKGTAIACSPDDRFLACGSASGVVNVYNTATQGGARAAKPSLSKAIMNLTTQSDVLRFNGDGQLLAIGSTRAKDAMRVVHVPSQTVYANFPSFRTPIQYLSTIDFSPQSGYMAIGNARGRVLLYRLNAYTSS